MGKSSGGDVHLQAGNRSLNGSHGTVYLSTGAGLSKLELDSSGAILLHDANMEVKDINDVTTFKVSASSGNTQVSGSTLVTGDLSVNDDKFVVSASSGNAVSSG